MQSSSPSVSQQLLSTQWKPLPYSVEEEEEEEEIKKMNTLHISHSPSMDTYFHSFSMAMKIHSTFLNTVSTMGCYQLSLQKIQQMCWLQFNEKNTETIYSEMFLPKNSNHLSTCSTEFSNAQWGFFFQMESICLQRHGQLSLSHYYLEKGKDLLLKAFFSEHLSAEDEYQSCFGLLLLANNLIAHGKLESAKQVLYNVKLDPNDPVKMPLVKLHQRTQITIHLMRSLQQDNLDSLLEQTTSMMALYGISYGNLFQDVTNLVYQLINKKDFSRQALNNLQKSMAKMVNTVKDANLKKARTFAPTKTMVELFYLSTDIALHAMCLLLLKQCTIQWKQICRGNKTASTSSPWVDPWLAEQTRSCANYITRVCQSPLFCWLPASMLPYTLLGIRYHMENIPSQMDDQTLQIYKTNQTILQILSERYVLPLEVLRWITVLQQRFS